MRVSHGEKERKFVGKTPKKYMLPPPHTHNLLSDLPFISLNKKKILYTKQADAAKNFDLKEIFL